MQNTELSPELADAADVLSDQLKVHLRRLSELLAPHADRLERKFVARLRALKYERKQRFALASITLGAAARILAEKLSLPFAVPVMSPAEWRAAGPTTPNCSQSAADNSPVTLIWATTYLSRPRKRRSTGRIALRTGVRLDPRNLQHYRTSWIEPVMARNTQTEQ